MANDDPISPPPAPAGNGSGNNRRGRSPRGEHVPRKPRLPQRDVADDEVAVAVATSNGDGSPEPADDASGPAPQVPAAAEAGEERGRLDLAVLKEMSIQKLIEVAKALEIPGATSMKKQELVFQILRAQAEKEGLIFSEGV